MLSRCVIAFLPRSKCLLVSRLQSPSIVILEKGLDCGKDTSSWLHFHVLSGVYGESLYGFTLMVFLPNTRWAGHRVWHCFHCLQIDLLIQAVKQETSPRPGGQAERFQFGSSCVSYMSLGRSLSTQKQVWNLWILIITRVLECWPVKTGQTHQMFTTYIKWLLWYFSHIY